jgi:hypothetical protein
MTTFLNGPAKGQTLMLKRSPILLRVCLNGKKWDALDQPDDLPHPAEIMFVYVLKEFKGHCMINPGGCYPLAKYELFEPTEQPSHAIMRNRDQWQKWCIDNGADPDLSHEYQPPPTKPVNTKQTFQETFQRHFNARSIEKSVSR